MNKSKLAGLLFSGLLSLIAIVAFAKQEKVIQIFSNGEVVQEYSLSDIDYIEVNNVIDVPANLNAVVGDRSITITWKAVPGATYNLYRSSDNTKFTLLEKGLVENKYTDNSPNWGSNYYRVKAVVDGVESAFTESTAATISEDGLTSGVYLGITGFNQTIQQYPMHRLSELSLKGYNDFIDGLQAKKGTVFYYAVDEALDTFEAAELPSDVSSVALVTFTDGLDQGSFMKKEDLYANDIEYLEALNKRITTETVAGKNIAAYSIGIRGTDVEDFEMFSQNLLKLASSPENATEVTSMAEVNAKFQEIAEQLSQSNYIQTINLKIPGVANGTKIRFTFDNVKDAATSELYLEGVFNLKTKTLEEVEYVGLTSTSGTSVQGVVDDIFVTFTFEGVHTADNTLIKSEFTDEWKFIESNSSWQINSEFDKNENSEIRTDRSSAAIMLVLDCSSSLGDQFVTAQANAKGFIKTLFDSSGLSTIEDPNNPTDDHAIYSTIPLDLSLAIWKDGKRYYVTEEQYQKANLSNAVIEGLTIIGGGESFILSLNNVQSNNISNIETAKKLYEDIMPTASQGRVISARWMDINNKISSFGGISLTGKGPFYTQSTDLSLGAYTNLIQGAGGSLDKNSYTPFIRGVVSTDHAGPKYWQHPDDLKLAVIINGERILFSDNEEFEARKPEVEKVEGVFIINGDEKFILALEDAQSSSISNVDTAKQLYGDIMPTMTQAKIISARWYDITSKITHFGGSYLNQKYFTQSTIKSGGSYKNVLSESGGSLNDSSSVPYVRGVTTVSQGD